MLMAQAFCTLLLRGTLAVGTASAQSWPARTIITAIIPFAPSYATADVLDTEKLAKRAGIEKQ